MGMRVLVAEDEALIALLHADILEEEGFAVDIAADGAEALEAARRLGADLGALVTDLTMPRMGGEALIHAVRADRPGLPVVVVTGSAPFGGAEELRRRAGGHGPLQLLLKPADCAELAAALRRATTAGAATAPGMEPAF